MNETHLLGNTKAESLNGNEFGLRKKPTKIEPSRAPEQVCKSHDKAMEKHLDPSEELGSMKTKSFPLLSHLS